MTAVDFQVLLVASVREKGSRKGIDLVLMGVSVSDRNRECRVGRAEEEKVEERVREVMEMSFKWRVQAECTAGRLRL
jgi:hypothetical protein